MLSEKVSNDRARAEQNHGASHRGSIRKARRGFIRVEEPLGELFHAMRAKLALFSRDDDTFAKSAFRNHQYSLP